MAGKTKTGIVSANKKAEQPAYICKYPHLDNTTWSEDQINSHADGAVDYYERNLTEPFISTYFTQLKIHPQTIARWKERSSYFANAWLLLKQMQVERLSKLSFNREYSTAGVIFAMKNLTEWRDTPQDQDPDDHELIVAHKEFAENV